MKEPLVTLETAKLAKEKGFDGYCYEAANLLGNLYSNGWCEYIDDNNTEIPFLKKDLEPKDYLIPTQSLLQKWLRDVHNIEIAVQWFDNCYIKAVAKKPFKANTYRVEGIESYEEALEAGLQEALNLIS